MKRFKSRLVVLIIFYLYFLICGCNSCSSVFYYDKGELLKTVEKVEIVNKTSNDEAEVIMVITKEQMEELFEKLSKIKYTYVVFGNKPIVDGICLKLYYYNGKIEFINHVSGMATASKTEFDKLIRDYIDK